MMPKGNWKTNIASERKRWGRERMRSSFESCCCCRCVVYFLHLHNSLFGYWFIKWHRQQSNDGVCAVGADWGNIGATTTTRAHTCRDGRPNYFLSVVVVLDIIEAWRIIFDRLATHTTIIVRFFFSLILLWRPFFFFGPFQDVAATYSSSLFVYVCDVRLLSHSDMWCMLFKHRLARDGRTNFSQEWNVSGSVRLRPHRPL